MSLLPSFAQRDALLSQLRQVSTHLEKGEVNEALELAKTVETECLLACVDSASVHWTLSICFDYRGSLREALARVLRAIELDPLHNPAEHSLGVIVDRARTAVQTGFVKVAPHGEQVAIEECDRVDLYGALAECGLADDPTRTAYSRLLLAIGRHAEALAIAQALVLLNPTVEALAVIEKAARALGNDKVAEQAVAQRMALRQRTRVPGIVASRVAEA